MTKQEATHLSEVFKAYSEGKKIQKLTSTAAGSNLISCWVDVDDLSLSDMHKSIEYRIKPKDNIRPYKHKYEFLKVQKEHGMYIVSKRDGRTLLPLLVNDKEVFMQYDAENSSLTGYTFNDLLNYWSHQDGYPCGMKE